MPTLPESREPERLPEPPDACSLARAARTAGLQVPEPALPQDRTVWANGLVLHYLDWGGPLASAGPDLLLLHGTAQQAHSWDFTALAMRDGYRVIALDQRGHGDSEWSPDGRYSPDDHQADLDQFVRALGLRRFVVCGLSMGGHNAYTFAARRPELASGLVVVDAAPEMSPSRRAAISRFLAGPGTFDTFDAAVRRVRSYTPHRTLEHVRAGLVHALRRLPDGRWAWKYDPRIRQPPAGPAVAEERWRALARVGCPTLFVRGERSGMITDQAMHRMLATTSGSRDATVSDAGHLVPGDNPAGFVYTLRAFLDGALEAAQRSG